MNCSRGLSHMLPVSIMTEPLPWQTEMWQQLLAARQQQRLPHALLLHGQAGLGKHHFAQAQAQALLCGKRGRIACGQCHGCRQFEADNSADFFAVEPADGKKIIAVAQIRTLIDALALTSHSGGRRVVIIEPADAMNISAANSLLKTLEEPPGDTVLMLVTARAARLPQTIRSRCRQLRFTLPRRPEALQWLGEQGIDEASAEQLLVLADRRPMKALALHNDDTVQRNAAIKTAVTNIAMGKANPVVVAERLGKEPFHDVIELLMKWVARLARASVVGDSRDAVADKLGSRGLFALHDRLLEVERLRDTSVNQQLLLESLLVPLAPEG